MRTYASWFSQVQAPERAGPSPNAYVSKRQHSSEQRRIRQHTSAFSPTPSPSPNSGAHHGGAGQEKSERQALQVLSLLALLVKKKCKYCQILRWDVSLELVMASVVHLPERVFADTTAVGLRCIVHRWTGAQFTTHFTLLG